MPAASRRRNRSDAVDIVAFHLASNYGVSLKWTAVDLKKKKINLGAGVLTHMHVNGLIERVKLTDGSMGTLRLSTGHCFWRLTQKGMMRATKLYNF